MNATGWVNSAHDRPNACYGIRISEADRDKFMSPNFPVIGIEIDGTVVAKRLPASFWIKCTEIRHPSITRFMVQNGLIPWPVYNPPKLNLVPAGKNTFRLTVANGRLTFCPACGAKVDYDALFCNRCGHKLSTAQETQPPAAIASRGSP